MGSENSTSITQSELESSFIGSVTDGSKPNSNPFNLYYRKSQDLLLIDVGETKCKQTFNIKNIVGVRNPDENIVEMMVYDEDKDVFEVKKFLFEEMEQMEMLMEQMEDLNLKVQEGRERQLCVFVNPVSGSGHSREYYKKMVIGEKGYLLVD